MSYKVCTNIILLDLMYLFYEKVFKAAVLQMLKIEKYKDNYCTKMIPFFILLYDH